MSRPFRCRKVERMPVFRSFSPDDITAAESVMMTMDEFEAMRLLDERIRQHPEQWFWYNKRWILEPVKG